MSERLLSLAEKLPPVVMDKLMDGLALSSRAILFAGMEAGVSYSKAGLFHLGMQLQGGEALAAESGWPMARGSGRSYCEDALEPAELVVFDGSGWQRNGWGDKVGVALAGHLMDISERYPEFPLVWVFGKLQQAPEEFVTIPQGARYTGFGGEERVYWSYESPMPSRLSSGAQLRRHLLEYLVDNQRLLPVRTEDIANALHQVNSVMGTHLAALYDAGVIAYSSQGGHEGEISFYQLASGIVRPSDEELGRLGKIRGMSMSRGVMAQLYRLLEQEPERRWHHKDLEQLTAFGWRTVNKALKLMKEAGLLMQVSRFNEEIRSMVIITHQRQLDFLLDVVGTLRSFEQLDPGVLEVGRYKARQILDDPERVRTLLAQAREASGHALSKSKAERMQELLAILREHEWMESGQIRMGVLSGGRPMSDAGIAGLLNYLLDRGLVQVDKSVFPHRWRVIG